MPFCYQLIINHYLPGTYHNSSAALSAGSDVCGNFCRILELKAKPKCRVCLLKGFSIGTNCRPEHIITTTKTAGQGVVHCFCNRHAILVAVTEILFFQKV